MSATRYKKQHVDILICIEMTREKNLGIKKTPDIVLCIYFPKKVEERRKNVDVDPSLFDDPSI